MKCSKHNMVLKALWTAHKAFADQLGILYEDDEEMQA